MSRRAGWTPYLAAIVVSQRVGTIKPHPAIFAAAARGARRPGAAADAILHVGDDWAADVVGAKRAGWRAAWLRSRPARFAAPGSEPADGEAEPDLVLDRLEDLEAALDGAS